MGEKKIFRYLLRYKQLKRDNGIQKEKKEANMKKIRPINYDRIPRTVNLEPGL